MGGDLKHDIMLFELDFLDKISDCSNQIFSDKTSDCLNGYF